MSEIEKKVAALEALLGAHIQFNMVMLKMVISRNPSIQSEMAEALRKLLVQEDAPLSPLVELQVRQLRDILVAPPLQEPPRTGLRPVD